VKLCYASPYLPWVQNNQYHPFYHCSFHTWLLFCIKSCWLNHDYLYFVPDLGKSFTQGVSCLDVFWLGGLITWTIISGVDMWLLSSRNLRLIRNYNWRLGQNLKKILVDYWCCPPSMRWALCKGRVSVRPSVRPSVPSIDSSSDVQLLCRNPGATGARVQQRAGSVSAVIWGESTPTWFLKSRWTRHLEQSDRQCDFCPVSVDLLSASENISVPSLITWH